MHASSGVAALPLSVPSSDAGNACSTAAFYSLVNLSGINGAAVTEATPIVLADDCLLLRCTDLTGYYRKWRPSPAVRA